MHPYEQLIYDRFVQTVKAWPAEHLPGIYAVAFFYSSFATETAEGEEMWYQGQVSIGYNLLLYAEAQFDQASSEAEAKWNLAFWMHTFSGQVPADFPYRKGEPPADEFALRDSWCASVGLPATKDESGRSEYDENELYAAVRDACKNVAQAFHENGVLTSVLGRTIPIVILGHDQPGFEEAGTIRAANPPGLSREAEEWLMGCTYAQLDDWSALQQEIKKKPAAEQAQYWKEAWLDFALERSSAVKEQMVSLNLSVFDMQRALTTVGAEAAPILIELVEQYVFDEQYENGRWTAASWITSGALHILRDLDLRGAEGAMAERLLPILTALYESSVGHDWVGTNLSGVAATLHYLLPERFPAPRTGSRDNKLLNAQEFGLPGV